MIGVKRSREEWEIREDARALARAEEIKADKERMKEAIIKANEIAEEEQKRISGIMKVAGKKLPRTRDTQQPDLGPVRSSYPNPATIGRF